MRLASGSVPGIFSRFEQPRLIDLDGVQLALHVRDLLLRRRQRAAFLQGDAQGFLHLGARDGLIDEKADAVVVEVREGHGLVDRASSATSCLAVLPLGTLT